MIKIMKLALCLSLLSAVCALADDAADRIAIDRVISSLNQPHDGPGAKPLSALLTSDADAVETALLSELLQFLEASKRPWSELATPGISRKAIRFVTPEVALVNARIAPYGIPALLVMKKVGPDWLIASFPEINGHDMLLQSLRFK